MFVMNGMVYGGEPSGQMKIVEVKLLEAGMMILTFDTGEKRLFDTSVLCGPVYEPLQKPEILQSVTIDHGVVTWMDGDIDCAPEFMYKNSYQYSDVAI